MDTPPEIQRVSSTPSPWPADQLPPTGNTLPTENDVTESYAIYDEFVSEQPPIVPTWQQTVEGSGGPLVFPFRNSVGERYSAFLTSPYHALVESQPPQQPQDPYRRTRVWAGDKPDLTTRYQNQPLKLRLTALQYMLESKATNIDSNVNTTHPPQYHVSGTVSPRNKTTLKVLQKISGEGNDKGRGVTSAEHILKEFPNLDMGRITDDYTAPKQTKVPLHQLEDAIQDCMAALGDQPLLRSSSALMDHTHSTHARRSKRGKPQHKPSGPPTKKNMNMYLTSTNPPNFLYTRRSVLRKQQQQQQQQQQHQVVAAPTHSKFRQKYAHVRNHPYPATMLIADLDGTSHPHPHPPDQPHPHHHHQRDQYHHSHHPPQGPYFPPPSHGNHNPPTVTTNRNPQKMAHHYLQTEYQPAGAQILSEFPLQSQSPIDEQHNTHYNSSNRNQPYHTSQDASRPTITDQPLPPPLPTVVDMTQLTDDDGLNLEGSVDSDFLLGYNRVATKGKVVSHNLISATQQQRNWAIDVVQASALATLSQHGVSADYGLLRGPADFGSDMVSDKRKGADSSPLDTSNADMHAFAR